MERKSDYERAKRKAKQLKCQIIAVILIIIINLGSGTAFAAVMLNSETKASQKMSERLHDVADGPEYKCVVTCSSCGTKHGYNYVPEHMSAYYCKKCSNNLENSPKAINDDI